MCLHMKVQHKNDCDILTSVRGGGFNAIIDDDVPVASK